MCMTPEEKAAMQALAEESETTARLVATFARGVSTNPPKLMTPNTNIVRLPHLADPLVLVGSKQSHG